MQQHEVSLPSPIAFGIMARRALRILWFTFILFVLSVSIGLSWDQSWHVTHVFDTFFAPPHVFTYSMIVLTTALIAYVTYSPSLRPAFGGGFRVPALPVQIPGSLVLLGSGFATLACAGVLDYLWHSRFGLDETGWSTPHAMIGWALLVVVLGFVACRLALRQYRPLHVLTPAILAILILAFSNTPFLGPLFGNTVPEAVREIALIPALAVQPPAQHTFRIYLAWNLSRTNPLIAPLGALWAGTVLALVRALDRRARIWITAAAVWSLLTVLSDLGTAQRLDQYFHSHLVSNPAAWLPLPILPSALVFWLLVRFHVPERWAWIAAGGLFGLLIAVIWSRGTSAVMLMVLSGPIMLLGAQLGKGTYRVLEHPTRSGVIRLVLVGIGIPFLVGAVDLYLRKVTT